jgi:hypothetical protein
MPTEFLFSYGTLQLEAVQMATFGRLLTGTRDVLPGFEEALLEVDDQVTVSLSGKRIMRLRSSPVTLLIRYRERYLPSRLRKFRVLISTKFPHINECRYSFDQEYGRGRTSTRDLRRRIRDVVQEGLDGYGRDQGICAGKRLRAFEALLR